MHACYTFPMILLQDKLGLPAVLVCPLCPHVVHVGGALRHRDTKY